MKHGYDGVRTRHARKFGREWFWPIGVTCLAAIVAPVPVHGQQRSADLVYEQERKDPTTAMALEAVLPFVGYAYAVDAGRGLIPGLVTIGGAGSALLGVVVWADEDEDCGGSVCASKTASTLLVGGLVVAGVGRLWGAFGAADAANRFNRDLRESLGLGANLDVSLRLDPGQRVTLAFSIPALGR